MQATVNRAIFPKQAVNLRQRRARIDELEAHQKESDSEILQITEPFLPF